MACCFVCVLCVCKITEDLKIDRLVKEKKTTAGTKKKGGKTTTGKGKSKTESKSNSNSTVGSKTKGKAKPKTKTATKAKTTRKKK